MNKAEILEAFVNATQRAAIAAHQMVGLGCEKSADMAAVNAMRTILASMPIRCNIVAGEGVRDDAPRIDYGEIFGIKHQIEIDVAVDPLECTNTLSYNYIGGSVSAVAFGPKGSIMQAKDVYMERIAASFLSNNQDKILCLKSDLQENIARLAHAKSKNIGDIVVCVLDRPRHKDLVSKILRSGARIKMIKDGDVIAIVETAFFDDCDMYVGIGGAPETVLAAAAIKALGGQICARFIAPNDTCLYTDDLIRDDVCFVASGITGCRLLKGITKATVAGRSLMQVHSVVLNSATRDIAFINNLLV